MICSSTRLLHLERWGVESIRANLLMQSVLVLRAVSLETRAKRKLSSKTPLKRVYNCFSRFWQPSLLRILQGIRTLVVNFLLSGALFGVPSDEQTIDCV